MLEAGAREFAEKFSKDHGLKLVSTRARSVAWSNARKPSGYHERPVRALFKISIRLALSKRTGRTLCS
jgi:hypothetical protein